MERGGVRKLGFKGGGFGEPRESGSGPRLRQNCSSASTFGSLDFCAFLAGGASFCGGPVSVTWEDCFSGRRRQYFDLFHKSRETE